MSLHQPVVHHRIGRSRSFCTISTILSAFIFAVLGMFCLQGLSGTAHLSVYNLIKKVVTDTVGEWAILPAVIIILAILAIPLISGFIAMKKQQIHQHDATHGVGILKIDGIIKAVYGGAMAAFFGYLSTGSAFRLVGIPNTSVDINLIYAIIIANIILLVLGVIQFAYVMVELSNEEIADLEYIPDTSTQKRVEPAQPKISVSNVVPKPSSDIEYKPAVQTAMPEIKVVPATPAVVEEPEEITSSDVQIEQTVPADEFTDVDIINEIVNKKFDISQAESEQSSDIADESINTAETAADTDMQDGEIIIMPLHESMQADGNKPGVEDELISTSPVTEDTTPEQSGVDIPDAAETAETSSSIFSSTASAALFAQQLEQPVDQQVSELEQLDVNDDDTFTKLLNEFSGQTPAEPPADKTTETQSVCSAEDDKNELADNADIETATTEGAEEQISQDEVNDILSEIMAEEEQVSETADVVENTVQESTVDHDLDNKPVVVDNVIVDEDSTAAEDSASPVLADTAFDSDADGETRNVVDMITDMLDIPESDKNAKSALNIALDALSYHEGADIIDIPRFYNDEAFRSEVLDSVPNDIKMELKQAIACTTPAATASLISYVTAFVGEAKADEDDAVEESTQNADEIMIKDEPVENDEVVNTADLQTTENIADSVETEAIEEVETVNDNAPASPQDILSSILDEIEVSIPQTVEASIPTMEDVLLPTENNDPLADKISSAVPVIKIQPSEETEKVIIEEETPTVNESAYTAEDDIIDEPESLSAASSPIADPQEQEAGNVPGMFVVAEAGPVITYNIVFPMEMDVATISEFSKELKTALANTDISDSVIHAGIGDEENACCLILNNADKQDALDSVREAIAEICAGSADSDIHEPSIELRNVLASWKTKKMQR